MIVVTQITKAGKLQRMISYGFPRTVYTNYVSKKRVDPDLNNFKPRLSCCGTKGFCS